MPGLGVHRCCSRSLPCASIVLCLEAIIRKLRGHSAADQEACLTRLTLRVWISRGRRAGLSGYEWHHLLFRSRNRN